MQARLRDEPRRSRRKRIGGATKRDLRMLTTELVREQKRRCLSWRSRPRKKRSRPMTNTVAGFRQPEPQQRRGTAPSNGRLLSEATGLEANRDARFRAITSCTHLHSAPRGVPVDTGMTECRGGKHGLSEELRSYGPTCLVSGRRRRSAGPKVRRQY